MCVVVVVVVFAQKKNFKRIGHKSVQNGAYPYKQFCGKIREQKQQN